MIRHLLKRIFTLILVHLNLFPWKLMLIFKYHLRHSDVKPLLVPSTQEALDSFIPSLFSHSISDGSLLNSSAAAAAKSLQSCTTLCDPTHGSPPDSAVLGILQARTLEWVAISFSTA